MTSTQNTSSQTLIDNGLEDELALIANYSDTTDPITYKDAMTSPNENKWLLLIKSEIGNLNKLNT